MPLLEKLMRLASGTWSTRRAPTAGRQPGRLVAGPSVVLAVALALAAIAMGCAGGPTWKTAQPLPHVSSSPPPKLSLPDASRPGTSIPWARLTRAGHEAMRPGQYALAEQQFVAALEATSGLPPYDVRTRTSLGNLTRLAARYHAIRRDADARRVMDIILECTEERGFDVQVAADYQDRYRELTTAPSARALFGPAAPFGRAAPRRSSRTAPRERTYDRLIAQTARHFGVDPALVKAVVAAESNFEVTAVSHVGAQGLMQLMPDTAREMGVDQPFEPRDNLRGGVRYLREMLDRFGDTRLALAAYNAGPTAVVRHNGVPPYTETRDYVKRVLRFYDDYRVELAN